YVERIEQRLDPNRQPQSGLDVQTLWPQQGSSPQWPAGQTQEPVRSGDLSDRGYQSPDRGYDDQADRGYDQSDRSYPSDRGYK
ncbi:MAG: hypothetical protein GXP28_10605, partial [Planctomycetes bacterium]|nr:hypothetical protein [Planctomycetota bacterium]